MGHKISETDQESMRQQLGIEDGGKVAFQDFADLVKKMFEFKLDMSMMEPTFLMGGIERKDSMELPPMKKVKHRTVCKIAPFFSEFFWKMDR